MEDKDKEIIKVFEEILPPLRWGKNILAGSIVEIPAEVLDYTYARELVLSKLKSVLFCQRKRAIAIVEVERDELMLHFHPDEKGDRVKKAFQNILDRLNK